jgi:drug/metabolite transporter (DMT)-like permease
MNTTHAKLLVLLAAFGWAMLGPIILCLPTSVSAEAICSFRGLSIALFFAFLLRRRKSTFSLTWSCILAGACYAASALSYVYSLQLIPIAVATPLHYTTPLFLLLGMFLFSTMIPSKKQTVSALLAGTGAIILAFSSGRGNSLGLLLALLSALSWAGYLALQNSLSRTERESAACIGGILLFILGLPTMTTFSFTAHTIFLLLLIALFSSALPLFLLAKASTQLSAVVISLLLITEPLFAALLALIINQQSINLFNALGLALIMTGSICGTTK